MLFGPACCNSHNERLTVTKARVLKTCHCGKQFDATRKIGAGAPKKMCGDCRESRYPWLKTTPTTVCVVCGGPVSLGSGGQTCSKRCLCIKANLTRHALSRQNRTKTCVKCGVEFTFKRRGGEDPADRKFCSRKCYGHRDDGNPVKQNVVGGKSRKRAKFYGVAWEKINPIDVFSRYKWQCAMCKVETPRSLRGLSLPNSPELDHIVPMACGGPHLSWNVQLSCRRCNMAKNDTRTNLL